MEQSRSKRYTALPCASHTICVKGCGSQGGGQEGVGRQVWGVQDWQAGHVQLHCRSVVLIAETYYK